MIHPDTEAWNLAVTVVVRKQNMPSAVFSNIEAVICLAVSFGYQQIPCPGPWCWGP